jgi:hypothetical protein
VAEKEKEKRLRSIKSGTTPSSAIPAKVESMKDYLYLGTTPSDEQCPQVGKDDGSLIAEICNIYRKQLQTLATELNFEVAIVVRSCNHDFGTYYEVAAKYDSNNERHMNEAFELDGKVPQYWNDESKAAIELLREKYGENEYFTNHEQLN